MRYNLDSTLPIRAFSPRVGRSPFALGMTLEGGGGPVSWVEDAVSSVGDAFESVGGAISDAGVTIDKAVIQPAIDDPAGTIVKIGAIAAAPVTGGTSLYAIPAYTATKAIAAGVPIEDAAKMTAISAAAAYAGVSVADYVGTLAEFGTGIGSQQTAMLAAQNVGIGTGGVASTAIGQVAGGAAGGALASGATGRDPITGLLTGAAGGAIGAGVGAAVDAGFEAAGRKPGFDGITSTATGDITFNDGGLFNNTATGSTNTGTTQMEDWLTESGYYDNPANIDTYTPPTAGDFQMGGGSFSDRIIPGELGDIKQDSNGNIILSSGADIQAAQSLGFDATTITNYAKQFGTAALKALLGSRGGTAGQGMGQGGLLGSGANYLLNQNQLGRLNTAYGQNVAGQQAATQTAQEQASFTPVGMTTAFGSSNFGFDPRTGKLTSAGYTPTSQVSGQVQNLFGLGASALPTTTNTQDIQNQYIAQQRGLLAPSREQQLAQLENRQYQTGRTGLATGGTMAGYAPNAQGLMATNPELSAYFNSLAQEDARLAANAPTYAQNQLNQQIATGTGLFGAANTLEGFAQAPLSLSTALGTAGATAGAKAGYYGLLGNQGALATQLQGQQANIYGQGAALGSVVNPLATALNTGITSMIPKTWLG